jgi:hypothetical protein
MVAAPLALLETQALKQLAQIVETNGRIGSAAEKQPQVFSAPISTFYAQPDFRPHTIPLELPPRHLR